MGSGLDAEMNFDKWRATRHRNKFEAVLHLCWLYIQMKDVHLHKTGYGEWRVYQHLDS